MLNSALTSVLPPLTLADVDLPYALCVYFPRRDWVSRFSATGSLVWLRLEAKPFREGEHRVGSDTADEIWA